MAKTWVDLLGMDTTNCKPEGCYIVRCNGNARCILFTFSSARLAQQVFELWIQQVGNRPFA